MAEKVETLVLSREDLFIGRQDKDIEDIEYWDFNVDGGRKFMNEEGLIIFIDETCEVKIIKNRWGKEGIIK